VPGWVLLQSVVVLGLVSKDGALVWVWGGIFEAAAVSLPNSMTTDGRPTEETNGNALWRGDGVKAAS